jgi:copper(I)-binding protein
VIAHRQVGRRIAPAVVAIGAVLLTGSCAAGQHAATAEIVPAIDGTSGVVGALRLEGVAIHAPSGASYAAGSNAELAMVIANGGNADDTLTNVASPAFSGWGIVATDAATSATIPPRGTPTVIPAGTSLSLGLKNLGTSSQNSPKTLVLTSLAKKSSPLFPGASVKITYTFAKAGAKTLTVPVQLASVPNEASVPAPSSSTAQG